MLHGPCRKSPTKRVSVLSLLRQVARRFAEAERPLALAEGLSVSSPHAMETAVAANLLSALKPGTQQTIDFPGTSAYSQVARAAAVKELAERMKHGDIEILLIHGANPVFSLPSSWEFQKVPGSGPYGSELFECHR